MAGTSLMPPRATFYFLFFHLFGGLRWNGPIQCPRALTIFAGLNLHLDRHGARLAECRSA
jgi:hypothetical protein